MSKKIEAIDLIPIVVMGSLFVLIDLLALLVAGPFKEAGAVAFVDPEEPLNLVYFFVILVVFTAVILLIARYGSKRMVQAIILGATAILDLYVFYPLLALVLPWEWSLGLAVAFSGVLLVLLAMHPEWYIIDLSAIITGVGATAMLGISLSVFLVIVLLIGMAVYDAISVYRTRHMVDLADTLVDLKLPVLFVIPKTSEYSLIKEKKSLKEKLKEGEKRDAFFMGAGDIVMPGILAAAAFRNPELGANAFFVALSVIVGTLVGFALLMVFVLKGKPQAGLPFLCPGAILGYLISSYLLAGTVGILLPF
jgi:presenilin-like A22 family membrane protease